jgi:hypothetical protein
MSIRAVVGQSAGQNDCSLTTLRDADSSWCRRCECDLARSDQCARVRPVPLEDSYQRLKVRRGKQSNVDRRMRGYVEIKGLDGTAEPTVGEPLRSFEPVSGSGALVVHDREHVLGDDFTVVPNEFTHTSTETLWATSRVATLAGQKSRSGDLRGELFFRCSERFRCK